jgi:hypothetical protein
MPGCRLKETTACQEATRAFLEEANVNPEKTTAFLEEIKSVVEHQEVLKEETAEETVGALDDRCADRHLAVGRKRNGPTAIISPGRSWPPPSDE